MKRGMCNRIDAIVGRARSILQLVAIAGGIAFIQDVASQDSTGAGAPGGADLATLEASEMKLKQMEEEVIKSLSETAKKRDTGVVVLPSAPSEPAKKEVSERVLGVSPPVISFTEPVKIATEKVVAHKEEKTTETEARPLKQVEKVLEKSPESKPKVTRVATTPREVDQKLEIAESQISILTRELNTMRRSLQSSERRIEELVRINREGGEPTGNGSTRVARPEYAVGKGFTSDEELTSVGDDRYYRGHTVPIGGKTTPNLFSERPPSSSDFATIVTHKAALRTGPGRGESALMMVPRDAVVTIELRTGNWYRVITAGGNRGWVAGDSLEFDLGESPDSASRVGPVRMAYEPTGIKH